MARWIYFMLLLALRAVPLVHVAAGCCRAGNDCISWSPYPDTEEGCTQGVSSSLGVATVWTSGYYMCATGGKRIQAGDLSILLSTTCVEVRVIDDPHFFGFGGEYYTFMGEVGQYYNIFSERNLQVNGQMVRFKNPGTYFGAIAMKYSTAKGTDEITVTSVLGSVIKIVVNGKELATNSSQEALDQALQAGGRLQVLRRSVDLDTVQLVTPTATLMVFGAGSHLDMFFTQINYGLCQVHGVLGQTYNTGKAAKLAMTREMPAKQQRYKMEVKNDVNKDYLVSGPFATDDVFNRYGKDVDCIHERSEQTARKMLTGAEGLKHEDTRFSSPVCAGQSSMYMDVVASLCGQA